jgi:predicted nucleotidyltransferase
MIRDGKKLPKDVLNKIPQLTQKISVDTDIVALYAFGSLAEGRLAPLSDLDFGVLVSKQLSKQQRSEKHLELLGTFNRLLNSDEVDLVVMNDAPPRFAYKIIRTGKLLHIGDKGQIIDFFEKTSKYYLDFKPIRDIFDNAFLEGIGYHG